MIVGAWVVMIGLRRFAARFGLLRDVAPYCVRVRRLHMIVLSSMVLVAAG
jgi:hypothetical protein